MTALKRDLFDGTGSDIEKIRSAAPELLEAARAAEQCITDFLEVYERGGSMTVLDLAVKSLKNDARKLVRTALIKAGERS